MVCVVWCVVLCAVRFVMCRVLCDVVYCYSIPVLFSHRNYMSHWIICSISAKKHENV